MSDGPASRPRQCPYDDCTGYMADIHVVNFRGGDTAKWSCPLCKRPVVVRHNGYPNITSEWTSHVPESAS